MRDGRPVPTQVFNGKEYHLYPGERYFSRHNKRLHRVVWEFYNGPIPEGYHVHHRDGNAWNNDIGNLELVQRSKHASDHTRKRVERDPEPFRTNMHKAMEAAKEWHRSEEGRQWHREHARAQGLGAREKVEYTCDFCGTKFLQQRANVAHHFCSNKCSATWRRREGVDDVVRVCEWCGKEFKTNRFKKQRFCSSACSGAHRRGPRK